jgi:hypothetical protein
MHFVQITHKNVCVVEQLKQAYVHKEGCRGGTFQTELCQVFVGKFSELCTRRASKSRCIIACHLEATIHFLINDNYRPDRIENETWPQIS